MLVAATFVVKTSDLIPVKKITTGRRPHTTMEAAPPSWFHWIVVVLGLVLPVFPVFLEVVICVVILKMYEIRKRKVLQTS